MKYTLLIDGHNFLFRTLYVLPQKKNQLLLSDKKSQDLFISKLSQNINSVLRDMDTLVDKCVLTLDSKSWRNEIKSDINYKGDRSQKETIDWNGFDICLQQFIKDVQKYNISISKTKFAEADDLIFMWSCALTAKGIPVIIYSSDKDMMQLISVNSSGVDTILLSDVTKKIYLPENFSNLASADSVPFLEAFSKGSTSIDIYDRFAAIEQKIRKKKLEKIEVDNIRFVFTKVLIGDKSDNISSAWSYEKNGRIYNITEAKAEKILDDFIEKNGNLNIEFLYTHDAIAALAQSCANLIKDLELDIVISNIKRNIKYMVLSKRVIPEIVIEQMTADIKEIAKNMKRVNFAQITTEEPVIKRSENIFSGVDDSDLSFIKKPEKSLF